MNWPFGRSSGSSLTLAGKPYNTQWTQVPAGASGSSAISTRLLASAGTPLHLRGGERVLSSQVCLAGIGLPSSKAVRVSCRALLFVVSPAPELAITSAAAKPKIAPPWERRHPCRREGTLPFMPDFTPDRRREQLGNASMTAE